MAVVKSDWKKIIYLLPNLHLQNNLCTIQKLKTKNCSKKFSNFIIFAISFTRWLPFFAVYNGKTWLAIVKWYHLLGKIAKLYSQLAQIPKKNGTLHFTSHSILFQAAILFFCYWLNESYTIGEQGLLSCRWAFQYAFLYSTKNHWTLRNISMPYAFVIYVTIYLKKWLWPILSVSFCSPPSIYEFLKSKAVITS